MKNYLDLIPKKNYNWKMREGKAIVIMPHKGFFSWIAHNFFGTPQKSYIALDDVGTFVWLLIDGKNTIGNIAGMVFENFPETVYSGIYEYFSILKKNKFICY